ncbi:hypothetical protein AeMF1_011012 [Aphanomyces euteiches]|nr:hypothetical protein AeMF1_011012 [Aphanomyces euteiches]
MQDEPSYMGMRPLSGIPPLKKPDIAMKEEFAEIYRSKMQKLTDDFVDEEMKNFRVFKRLWSQHRLSALYHIEFGNITRHEILYVMLRECLGSLVQAIALTSWSTSQSSGTQVATMWYIVARIFALYCTYECQIGRIKQKILLDLSSSIQLALLPSLALEWQVSHAQVTREAMTMLSRLDDQNAFCKCLKGYSLPGRNIHHPVDIPEIEEVDSTHVVVPELVEISSLAEAHSQRHRAPLHRVPNMPSASKQDQLGQFVDKLNAILHPRNATASHDELTAILEADLEDELAELEAAEMNEPMKDGSDASEDNGLENLESELEESLTLNSNPRNRDLSNQDDDVRKDSDALPSTLNMIQMPASELVRELSPRHQDGLSNGDKTQKTPQSTRDWTADLSLSSSEESDEYDAELEAELNAMQVAPSSIKPPEVVAISAKPNVPRPDVQNKHGDGSSRQSSTVANAKQSIPQQGEQPKNRHSSKPGQARPSLIVQATEEIARKESRLHAEATTRKTSKSPTVIVQTTHHRKEILAAGSPMRRTLAPRNQAIPALPPQPATARHHSPQKISGEREESCSKSVVEPDLTKKPTLPPSDWTADLSLSSSDDEEFDEALEAELHAMPVASRPSTQPSNVEPSLSNAAIKQIVLDVPTEANEGGAIRVSQQTPRLLQDPTIAAKQLQTSEPAKNPPQTPAVTGTSPPKNATCEPRLEARTAKQVNQAKSQVASHKASPDIERRLPAQLQKAKILSVPRKPSPRKPQQTTKGLHDRSQSSSTPNEAPHGRQNMSTEAKLVQDEPPHRIGKDTDDSDGLAELEFELGIPREKRVQRESDRSARQKRATPKQIKLSRSPIDEELDQLEPELGISRDDPGSSDLGTNVQRSKSALIPQRKKPTARRTPTISNSLIESDDELDALEAELGISRRNEPRQIVSSPKRVRKKELTQRKKPTVQNIQAVSIQKIDSDEELDALEAELGIARRKESHPQSANPPGERRKQTTERIARKKPSAPVFTKESTSFETDDELNALEAELGVARPDEAQRHSVSKAKEGSKPAPKRKSTKSEVVKQNAQSSDEELNFLEAELGISHRAGAQMQTTQTRKRQGKQVKTPAAPKKSTKRQKAAVVKRFESDEELDALEAELGISRHDKTQAQGVV